MSFLPLCESTLYLHVKRVNFGEKIWKTYLDCNFTLPNIQNHNFLDSGAIQWLETVFPEDYCDCLSIDTEEIA